MVSIARTEDTRAALMILRRLTYVSILLSILARPCPLSAQPRFRIPLTVTDSSARMPTRTVFFGVHPDANNCPSEAEFSDGIKLGGFTDHWDLTSFFPPDSVEIYSLPDPPSDLEVRFVSLRGQNCTGCCGILCNIRQFQSHSQVDTFHVGVYSPAETWYMRILRWPSPTVLRQYCDSMMLKGRVLVDDDPVMFDSIIVSMTTDSMYHAHLTPAHEILRDFLIYMYGPKNPPSPPDTLEAVWPPNGGTDTSTSLTPTLVWTAGTGVKYYRVQASLNSVFSSLIVNDSLTTNSRTLLMLQNSTMYFWRVVVFNDYGVSYWQNPPLSFTTANVVGVGDEHDPGNPRTFALYQNHPNPRLSGLRLVYLRFVERPAYGS